MDPSPTTLEMHTQKPAAKTGDENSKAMGHPRQPLGQSPMPETQNDPEFWPLSMKPYFYVVLEHPLKKMKIPGGLSEKLPAASGPAKIICRGKVWDLPYKVASKCWTFEHRAWEQFVSDNKIETGDACVFELVESSSDDDAIQFKVQILKDDFPSELLENVEGFNSNNPISLD